MVQYQQAQHETVLDDASRHVARVYAEALYNAADQQGQAEAVLANLRGMVEDVFGRDPQVETFIATPVVGRKRKAEAIRQTFEGRADPLFVNFLLVLNGHDRLDALRAIARAYRDLYEQRTGKARVLVRSAMPLAENQLARLADELRAVLGREPVLETRVEPELLGGLVLQSGDWVYDASVRSRLTAMRNQLIERSSHEIQGGRNRFRD
jgi:F-type H+-transporting ATPase subunit delta